MQSPISKSAFPPKFRTDIQALRGFAVLIVLFYHAKIGGLSAGFLGVDVFFVISGFLITSHVRDSIERGTFTFKDFYFRRAKRLLPAAYVTFLVTALLAPFFLTSSEMSDFRSQMAGAVTFVANIVLWRQSGYFAGDAALKPLLHVWSLSIEEQYYFILPALMFFIPRRFWKQAAILVFMMSLTLCLFMVHQKAAATFYLLPTRGWELAVGSIGALVLSGERLARLWKVAFWPALAVLLALPIMKIASFHPGPDALLICLATLVVILRKHPLLFRGPAMHGLGWVGDISYSLYLVHWPLFAFLNNSWLGANDPPLTIRFGLLVVSLVLAWALNRYVEEPTRKADIKLNRHVLVRTAAASFVLLMLPVGISQAIATEKNFAHILRSNRGFDPSCDFKGHGFEPIAECRNSDQPETLVWGDSYAMHLVPGILGVGEEQIVQATRSVCGPLLGVAPVSGSNNQKWGESCIDFNDSVVSYLAKANSINTVVLSSPFIQFLDKNYKNRNWTLLKKNYTDGSYHIVDVGIAEAIKGMERTINAVRKLGKRVVVIAPPPSNDIDLGRCLERIHDSLPVFGIENDECQISINSWKVAREPVLTFLSAMTEQAEVEVIHLSDYLCDSGICKTYIEGTFIYRDAGHLSYEGSVFLAKEMELAKKINDFAR